jgi:pilus biogenesis lipoprotein CpaD
MMPNATAPDESARLEAFLNSNDVAPGARVTLSTSGSIAPAQAVRDRLVAYGVRPSNIVIRSTARRERSNLQLVDVSVEQDQVQPPECGHWDPNRHFEDTSSDFGCSTVRALGLMVADPHDLVAGKDAGHTSAPPQVGAIERYHTDKQTPFVANKIGTYLKALAADDNDVPFYVALPSPTIDWTVADGLAEIPIEERSGDEVSLVWGKTADGKIAQVRVSPDATPAANPAFDVTPARLVSGLITERGVCPASRDGLLDLYPERRG